MGMAIDCVGFFATNPGAGGAAATVATGDSFTVRSAAASSKVILEEIVRQGVTAGFVRVRSPLLHDNVRGIMITPTDTPSRMLLPPDAGQPLTPLDNLIVELSGGAAEVDGGFLEIYYENAAGLSQRLHSPGDIIGNIRNIKPMQVAVAVGATAFVWTDVVITTTENLLHAASDYAVLGYVVDTACAAVGIKGQDTSNLRVCGWGSIDPTDTSDYFIKKAERENRPWIPVINAQNRFSTFASILTSAVAGTINVQFILAELASTVTP
jgi:hypothetical protein